MFGYVKTDLPNVYMKDTVLYGAMYCGLCKGIGCSCGQKARLALNYDLTFLSVLAHNLADKDVKIEKQRCVTRWLVARPVAVPDDLTKRIASLNVILAYYKCNDDVIDGGKGKLKRAFFKSSYKKARKNEHVLDRIVAFYYDQLLELERQGTCSVDQIADPFGNMMKDIINEILGDNSSDDAMELAYQLGRWIYLIDALDDFDKDRKKKDYNVFVNAYPEITDKKSLVEKHGETLKEIFGSILNEIKERAVKLKYKFNHDLTDNILLLGLKAQTKRIMENEKCKNTTKF